VTRFPGTAGDEAPAEAGTCPEPLERLCALETVQAQLADVLAVLEAEQARRRAGAVITRPAWKHLVFTGAPGSGKSRAASATARAYQRLGALSRGEVTEAAAQDLVGAGPAENGALLADAMRQATGGTLMICAAHAWHDQPGHGQQPLRLLAGQLAYYRAEMRDELAVILAGERDPLLSMLDASPQLTDRIAAVIDFPPYDPGQLAAIFTVLAAEAGLTPTPGAAAKAAKVLAAAEAARPSGNARQSARLLHQATALQARRVRAAPRPHTPALLTELTAADIPDRLDTAGPAAEGAPGQYL